MVEKDGYEWIRMRQGNFQGAKSMNGAIIVPLSKGFDRVYCDRKGYFHVEQYGKWGIYSKSGEEIIPVSHGYDFISFRRVKGHVGFFHVKRYGREGICDIYGNQIIPCAYNHIFFSDSEEGFMEATGSDYRRLYVTLDSSGNGVNLGSTASSHSHSHESSSKKAPCFACNGRGSWTIGGLNYICQACKGKGYTTSSDFQGGAVNYNSNVGSGSYQSGANGGSSYNSSSGYSGSSSSGSSSGTDKGWYKCCDNVANFGNVTYHTCPNCGVSHQRGSGHMCKKR